MFIYNQIATLYSSGTYVEINEKVFGKWIGKILVLFYLFYFYYLSAGMIRDIGNFFTSDILVDTPIEVVMILFLLISLFGVQLGLEVISRTALIFFPWIIALLSILILFLIPEIKLENMQPILGDGLKPIIKSVYRNLGLPYLELVIILMITPYVSEKTKINKAFYIGTLIGGIVLTILVIFSILILGTETSSINAYPSYALGQRISIGGFLERIEVIVAIIWVLTIYFKVTLCYYGLSIGLAQVLGLKSYKILLFPLAFLILTFSIFAHPNIVHFNDFTSLTWTPYSLTVCFFLPLLLLIVGKVRQKRSASSVTKQTDKQDSKI
ncbi:endospore germination permease [Metabacillus litoralis]|uniref:GerAB/ArcD/ProY family transporter n=1 Tax=Metabacillus litoralis TaxID=152268 RepID=UPI00293036D7|nr:endospore germination permease [Metabacillus litoralis]